MTLIVIRDEKILEVPPHLVQLLLKIVDKGEEDDFLELVKKLPESRQKPEAVVVLGKMAGYEIATTSLQTLLEVMVNDAKTVAERVDPFPYQRSLPLMVAVFEKIRPGYISSMTDVAQKLASMIPDKEVAAELLEHFGWVLDEKD